MLVVPVVRDPLLRELLERRVVHRRPDAVQPAADVAVAGSCKNGTTRWMTFRQIDRNLFTYVDKPAEDILKKQYLVQ
jgi:hypothetical protein